MHDLATKESIRLPSSPKGERGKAKKSNFNQADFGIIKDSAPPDRVLKSRIFQVRIDPHSGVEMDPCSPSRVPFDNLPINHNVRGSRGPVAMPEGKGNDAGLNG